MIFWSQHREERKTAMSHDVTNEQLREHFNEVLTDAEALVKATADLGGETLNVARTRARESLRVGKLRLAEAQQVVTRKARMAADATDTYVRESPWEAIGIAAGVGVLVGVLLARR
jgi:ElaB/YqjD/DUF883 family membrane-anchored ribosome-binding protein